MNIYRLLTGILLSTLAILLLFAPVGAQQFPDLTQLVKKVEPSVVNVSTSKQVEVGQRELPLPEEFFNRFFGDEFRRFFGDPGHPNGQQRRSSSLGSGFIVSSDGYIVTNNHVVEGADEITIILSDEREFKAEVVGTDATYDLALLKINASNLPALPLGNSDTIEVGQWVFAVGNPFGLSGTVTVGVISAKDRYIGQSVFDSFLQTDASINPGNSGGPLLNLKGEVIGINTAIVSSGQGLGFAIPINTLKSSYEQLKEKGRVSRGWLGVSLQRLTPELARSMGAGAETTGVLVTSVEPDQPAQRGGLREGDIITSFDNQRIDRYQDIFRFVARATPGSTVPMEILREGRRQTLRVTLGERPDERRAQVRPRQAEPAPSAASWQFQGIHFEMRDNRVVVQQVEAGSKAYEAGVRRDMVILRANNVVVSDLATLEKAIKERSRNGFVNLLVQHQGANRFIPFQIQQ
ncbi:protease Do [Desulfurispirillum indicum S5]|uniref:Probable periplasmic serine endoprotease DegP-like n=1 Tax=Desulfurispirillum indicum (strain ATCC BAA-1389 / DSM 22839 / S5) TaxID=653733 RepID=E6W177_DESIS|nr:Do family serine endopeptidase [Desulfurispirillum indicum]ADU66497.1 protease Do [Desulfurispirillum indicum S5]